MDAVSSDQSRKAPKFIIWAATYDETSGGTIALHTLCDRLNQLGAEALIWSQRKPAPHELKSLRGLIKFAVQLLKDSLRPYDTGPFPRRLATARDLDNAIVVYPEIVSGNPLNASNVVRWLLYMPIYHHHKSNYGKDDLYFFYQDRFNDPVLNPDSENLLRVTTVHPAYIQTNTGKRCGSAYIVRKGNRTTLDKHPAGAIKVDELSHEEKAAVFNQVERFYSYDPYTMYSIYAALCGCISIVIPEVNVDRDEWYSDESRRLGIAYGDDDIPWAVKTGPALFERLERERAEEDALVATFIRKCADKFAPKP